MKINQRLLICALACAALFVFGPASAEAGGHFGLHIGTGGFGVSVGVGDWGVYTNAWSDPHWSLSFNTALNGYGEWIHVDGLGRCWRPWVNTGWRPYTHGRWVRTGWNLTWVAYEPWGYIPHHYGSWAHARCGWVWVPGYTYAPANVTWVRGGGHIGWYARPPHGWSHSARAYHHGYHKGYRDGWNDARYGTYVGWQHFGSDNVSRHAVTHTAASKTRLTHGGAVPSNDELWRNGRSKVSTSRVSTRTARVDGREIVLARPEGVAASIERHASPTVRTALSEPARRSRQPRVESQQAGLRRSTAGVGSSRTGSTRSRVASPPSTARHTAAKRTLPKNDFRSSPSQSKSRSIASRAKQPGLGRADRSLGARSAARMNAPSRASSAPERARRSATLPSHKDRSSSVKKRADRSTTQKRASQAPRRQRKINADQASEDPTMKSTERRAVVRKR